jgi:hypothetical protein
VRLLEASIGRCGTHLCPSLDGRENCARNVQVFSYILEMYITCANTKGLT